MVNEATLGQITDLLYAAHLAHSEYTMTQAEIDPAVIPDWNVWYAKWLVDHRLSRIVGQRVAPDQLANMLRYIHTHYSSSRNTLQWTPYVAERLYNLFVRPTLAADDAAAKPVVKPVSKRKTRAKTPKPAAPASDNE